MGVHVHRGRTDGLVRGLAELLSTPPDDPFTPDVVAVPTRGIERYLAQELATRLGTGPGRSDGVCANVVFPHPNELVAQVVDPASRSQDDPWHPRRSVWPLLAVVDAADLPDWAPALARHLGVGPGPLGAPEATDEAARHRRFAVASRLATRFHEYATQRPTMVQAWAGRTDTLGDDHPLPADLRWQPELWRRLRAAIGTPSPAERLGPACATVRADPARVALPARISVFGPSRLTAEQLAVLLALAEGRDVHLWLAQAASGLRHAPATPATRRAADTSAALVRHPLLRSLGRDSRELSLRLTAALPATATDQRLPAPWRATGLLGRVQEDLRDDRDPTGPDRMAVAATDDSIQVHACHGGTRQAEVLREVVLGLLADDPTLEPRDVLVMCPDTAGMAPLISAAFAAPRPDAPTAQLRVRIADRTPEQANDVLATLDVLLALAADRMPRSAVLDLVSRPPVRARFGFSDDEVARIEALVVEAGVRWGLDERTRAAYRLDGLAEGTWQWGLERLLLGLAMSEAELACWHGVLPADGVRSGDAALLGRLAELLARLREFRDGTHGRHPMTHWVALLDRAVTGLCDARGTDAWQIGHALGTLAELAASAGEHADRVPLGLADLRWMLADVLAGRPTRSNFRSGGLTVCGLEPMRSVPYRVVCLVGMDDSSFPRAMAADGDDVLARDPWIGERDPRSEDRQVLLDAVMAATDHLVVTYTGADERTNEPRPPCVPLGELLDALDATAVSADGRPIRAHVVTRHPLQPFDPRNFEPGRLVAGRSFSHDPDALAGAREAVTARSAPDSSHAGRLLDGPLPVSPVEELGLAELVRFLGAPVATFLRTRLGLALADDPQTADEGLPIQLSGLEAWRVGQRAVDLLLAGHAPAAIAAAEQARATLPPGGLGGSVLSEVGASAEAIATAARAARGGEPRLVPISLRLPSGRSLTGTVDDVFGATLVRTTYSAPKPRFLLGAWPELLAAAVAMPGPDWLAVLVGKGAEVRLTAPDAAGAASLLDELLDLYVAGQAGPLPLPAATAMAYAEARRNGMRERAALLAAGAKWRAERFGDTGEIVLGECTEPAHALLHGVAARFEALLGEPAGSAERWFPDEGTRFGALARRLWDPLLLARDGPR